VLAVGTLIESGAVDVNKGVNKGYKLMNVESIRSLSGPNVFSYRPVLVEEMFPGRNYRVVVVAGKMVAASERFPSTVVGDGVNSIRELIEIENNVSLAWTYAESTW
jgi:D-alanine-D-alanine ligase-like ATP-grasp enzyme